MTTAEPNTVGPLGTKGGAAIQPCPAMRNLHPPIANGFALKPQEQGQTIVLSGHTAATADFALLMLHHLIPSDGPTVTRANWCAVTPHESGLLCTVADGLLGAMGERK